jgi:K+-transporting ATPase ATPase C chain
MTKELIVAVRVLLVLTVLTGAIYPLVITGIGGLVWPAQAAGSLIERDGKIVGSSLIAQPFTGAQYFWPRGSATSPSYNGGASSGSNQGPLNPALVDAVKDRIDALEQADAQRTAEPSAAGDSLPKEKVPVDLVTASSSGLDPHISPAAAEYQVPRVARARGMTEDRVRELVTARTESRTFGILGEPRVNVLLLNLALDDAKAT